ncbi:MAG: hypothetical protein Q4A71_05045 [Actinomycetaceae bacterium]|nr:hypothetical protein [Actinomycetaceae bacterium]
MRACQARALFLPTMVLAALAARRSESGVLRARPHLGNAVCGVVLRPQAVAEHSEDAERTSAETYYQH